MMVFVTLRSELADVSVRVQRAWLGEAYEAWLIGLAEVALL